MNEVTREKLSADFKAVIGDVDELVRATTRQTGEKIADLRERWGKKLEDGRKALSEQKPLLARVEEARASAEAYVREKRWAPLAIAAGIGLDELSMGMSGDFEIAIVDVTGRRDDVHQCWTFAARRTASGRSSSRSGGTATRSSLG